MAMTSFFKANCRFCGDEMYVGPEECHRCHAILVGIKRLSLPEVARIIDAAASVPEGTYKIVTS